MISKVMYKMSKNGFIRVIFPFGTATLGVVSLLIAIFPNQASSTPSSNIQPSSASETYTFVTAWDNAPPPGTFKEPRGIAVDPSGNVYVADTGNYRIQKFTADGVFITEWGTEGSEQGMFREPTAIAVDSVGNVYVGDLWSGIHEFQKFDPSGEPLPSWSLLHGYDPVGIALDGSDNVYIATRVGYGLVLKYDSSGQLLTQWQCSSESTGESKGIAVDPQGYVYVADPRNSVIYKFDLDGQSLTSWAHSFSSWFVSDSQLAVDGTGNVYALEQNQVVKYSSNGTRLNQWGQFNAPHGVAVSRDGSVYVVDTGNNRIQKFTADGIFIGQWGTLSDRSALRHPEGVTVSSNGTVFVADVYGNQVMAFTSNGEFLTRWSTMEYPSGMSTDSNGNVYVSGPGVPDLGSRSIYGFPYGIRKYSSEGVQLNQWGQCCGSADAQTDWASGIAVSPQGIMVVADTNNHRILKLNTDGSLITKWGSYGNEIGQFNSPQGVALAPDGSVYVADTLHNCIQKFTSAGGYLARWGEHGTGDGQFDHPKGIAVDSSGYVYVADAFNHRVQKFSPDGAFVTKWGNYGHENGQFDTPLGIAVDSNGFVYVADSDNNRIQKFAAGFHQIYVPMAIREWSP